MKIKHLHGDNSGEFNSSIAEYYIEDKFIRLASYFLLFIIMYIEYSNISNYKYYRTSLNFKLILIFISRFVN